MLLLPYFRSFKDELQKIANFGALAGGLAGGLGGYALGPKSVKGKIIGTALGAGTGAALGGTAGLAKRKFYDEPLAREHSTMQYTPAAVQQSMSSPYGPHVY